MEPWWQVKGAPRCSHRAGSCIAVARVASHPRGLAGSSSLTSSLPEAGLPHASPPLDQGHSDLLSPSKVPCPQPMLRRT